MRASNVRIDGAVAFVSLTRGYEAVIDAGDIPIISGFKWHAAVCPGGVYARRCAGRDASGRQKFELMHRLLAGAPQEKFVDHANGNGLDNRKHNIRVASRAENNRNAKIRVDNTSGHKGTSFHRRIGKWQAYINCDGKRLSLGYFNEENEAADAYRAASFIFHGEFRREDNARY